MAQTNPLVALHPVGRAVHNGARSATTVVGRTKLTTLATIDVQWHFFLISEIGTKFQDMHLFMEIPKFHINTL